PNVILMGGAGSGAMATATLPPRGIAPLPAGGTYDGFAGVPTITISGGNGSGASAQVTSMGVQMTAPFGGSGYTSAPSCTIVGGGGTGAPCSCVTSGTFPFCNVTNPGSGYTSIPSVIVSGGGGTGWSAVVSLKVMSVSTTPGSGYTIPPTVTYSPDRTGATY